MRLRGYLSETLLGLINLGLTLPGHEWRVWVLRRLAGNVVGTDVTIQRRVRITTRRGVTIGDRTIINRGTVLDGRGTLVLGEDVNVSPEASFLTADHDPRSPGFAGRNRAVRVGDSVWVATGAMVLPGTTVGAGAVIGAGSVVSGQVPEWSIVAGNPARRVADRPQNAQARLAPHRRFLG